MGLTERLLGLVFPGDIYCISCGRPLLSSGNEGLALCARCTDEIEWTRERRCEKCGRKLTNTDISALCSDCTSVDHVFRKGYACAMYTGRAAELVRSMKYKEKSYFAETLSSFMAARYFAEADPVTGELLSYDGVIPVPMNPAKKAMRGYDQAALLAKAFAEKIAIPYYESALIRMRETDVMSGLSADERRQNLSGAFEVSRGMIKEIDGKSFLLVDDVFTTGSSADECAATLVAAGAANADIMVFAIGSAARRAEDRPAVIESPGQLRAKGPT